MKTPDHVTEIKVGRKTPDMAKENNFVLREAAKSASMGYYDHLAAGGKGDPAEERWIEALTAGADAITQVSVLESRLAQVERERVELLKDFKLCVSKPQKACKVCANREKPLCSECERWDLFEWCGPRPENTKEEPQT